MPGSRRPTFVPSILAIGLLISAGSRGLCADNLLELQGPWHKSQQGSVHETFLIRGTGGRNNPLRRKLKQPFSGDQIFVQFRLTYAASSIDQPADGDGEFFVFWLDDHDGGDGATHTATAPNVGVHVSDGENRFMVRYDAKQQSFTSVELEGDREYRIAARLTKSKPGMDQPFDRIDVWVDPAFYDEDEPDASASRANAITTIEWFGFSTGGKTESKDQIHVSDVRLAGTWREMLGLPAATQRPEPKPSRVETQLRRPKTVVFHQHVLPILRDHCFQCHEGTDAESGVRLDVVDEVLNRVVPRNGAASHLIALVRSADDSQRMPPTEDGRAPLTQSQIDTLITWIDEGLDWDHAAMPAPALHSDHWAFQPVVRPQVPEVANQQWVRTPVDAFVARRHQQRGLAPSELAGPEILARRISLDLTGLPLDTPPEFGDSHDTHALADALIERQLTSPQFGQRYGRHWLDLARFGESNGHQHNRDRPNAWRYRDYVIASFRSGKPFDQFVREQIAGDELPFAAEHLVATGFLAAARYSGNELDEEIQRNDILVDIVNTTSKAFLGVTLECAQCHSHKFDPFTIRDYYRLQAFFGNGQPGNLVLREESDRAKRLIAARWEMFDDVHARLVDDRRRKGYPEPVLVIPKSVFSGMKGIERELFGQLESEIKQLPQTWGWNAPTAVSSGLAVAPHEMRWPLPRNPAAAPTLIRIRGDVKSRGPAVEPGWPAVFGPTPTDMKKPRTALAHWLTSRDNPLTARVWVNRLWQWHFGRGLVASSGDFGTQGTSPTHPDLLDWLAVELIENNWSTNHIHRLILRSNTYRQSSAFSQSNENIDADNAYLWRWRPRRLEAESIRDSVLAVAGTLDLADGGPSVPIQQAASSVRRSVFLQQKRDNLPEALSLFDAPEAVNSCSRRRVSTVSLQPLFLLNSEFMNAMANKLADRVRSTAASESDWAHVAFQITLGREPDGEERQRSQAYLADNSLESYCQALLNLNEFLYIN